MKEHPLDRPVWASLSTIHKEFSAGSENAKRFLPDIGPLTAIADESDQSLRELAELLERFGSLAVGQVPEFPCPSNGVLKAKLPVVQMLYEGPSVPQTQQELIEPLGSIQAEGMYALAKMTDPGPFEKRTHELGQFWGIMHDDQLVAMAGERLKSKGFVEVSGVCTNPEFEGRGYGKALCMQVCNVIQTSGSQPFLHVFEDNTRATGLYEALGFVPRAKLHLSLLTLDHSM